MDKVFTSLGLDWQSMIFQLIAFAILVFILAKFVYPPILAMLDRREKIIEESVRNAKEMNNKAAKMDDEISRKLADATAEAQDIVDSAREQGQQMVLDSEEVAAKRADSIVASARLQLNQDIEAARKTLRDEAAGLVAQATEKIIYEKMDSDEDQKLIKRSLSNKDRISRKSEKEQE